ncbi:alpha/beta hydrolase [Kordiimonas aquimaris]|uniref:alpha/beta hydrolase n=1 Tax=Kordiimonas aquimaris TaxID=707591 RepID=UPI0021D23A6A|nr:alpha/beta hydrolase [Kordiimonas aquimaris]
MLFDIVDWDDAYSNAKYIQGSDTIVSEWNSAAQAFREQAKSNLNVEYGDREREKFDLFLPKEEPLGLVVFIHGGYWLDFDKSSWSHLANGSVKNGWAVCMPSYDLCPNIRIAGITKQIGAAINTASEMVKGPINITGHSAGGHLAVRMGCISSPLRSNTVSRVKNIVGISGLYDLNPLMATSMNKTLRIDEAEAASESPVLLEPAKAINFTSWVGSDERPEFLRQSKLLQTSWYKKNVSVDYVQAPAKHHFNVIAPLADGNSELVKSLLE